MPGGLLGELHARGQPELSVHISEVGLHGAGETKSLVAKLLLASASLTGHTMSRSMGVSDAQPLLGVYVVRGDAVRRPCFIGGQPAPSAHRETASNA